MRNEVARGAGTRTSMAKGAGAAIGGRTRRRRRPWRRAERQLSQREVLRDVMLSANQCGAWLTLRELSLITHFGEASISAQLRHFRKEEFGAYEVEKRLRTGATMPLRLQGAVWEYRMSPRVRVVCGRSIRPTRSSSPRRRVSK